ncbi:MAG: MarR family winged helix-turn-helix transcriptional regulator [Wenzhouxiangella sp.]
MPAQIEALRLSIDALVRVFKITDSPTLGPGMPKLNPPDMQALLFIARNPGCIAADLGGFLGIVPTTTSALVDRLVRQGLLLRERTEANRRIVLLKLSAAGETVVEKIIAQQNEHCRIMLSVLSDTEREAFLSAAQKISAAIS